jgi:regulator of RNase E activity RraA
MSETDNNVARAARLDTPTLSDALDRLGIVGQCYKIKPRDVNFRMAGRASTLK